MTWEDALEVVVSRTRHERYRVLCHNKHPDHTVWRAKMLAMVGEPISEDPNVVIARVEAMAARANAGERGGCGGCP